MRLLFVTIIFLCSLSVSAQGSKTEHVILVHGAFAPRSGWQPVYQILTKNGYDVTVVQIPLTSLKEDVAAVERSLERIDAKVVLVGHSWSGSVITQAGAADNVAALVYVDAFQPDKGETTLQWVESAPAAPESGLLPPDENGFVYFDKAKFHAGFAADIPKEQALFMADSQQPIAAHSFVEEIAVAAWHDKPSFGIIATRDKSINPEILHAMYERSNTKITEIEGASHAVFLSHPKKVAKVIMEASYYDKYDVLPENK